MTEQQSSSVTGEVDNGWPPPFEMMKLQARPADGGDWCDIFPSQLEWMAKNGADVRAIEGPAVPALTTPQFLDGTKDVTRRMGWLFLKPGDELCAVEKGQGLGKGGKIKRLGTIKVLNVWREKLCAIESYPRYGIEEVAREGFPDLTASEFISFFCDGHKKCKPSSIITRIEFVKTRAYENPDALDRC